MQDKYTVFKTEQLQQMLGGFLPKDDTDCAPIAQSMLEAVDETRLADAVVIRQKDIFAGTALHAYSAAVHNAIEIMESVGAGVPEHLYSLRDDFAELAEGADAFKAKRLPD